jgi:hypothetical protein
MTRDRPFVASESRRTGSVRSRHPLTPVRIDSGLILLFSDTEHDEINLIFDQRRELLNIGFK